jgi:hypothetical protein
MKVYHILSETLDVKQVNGMWRVFDTVKNQVVGDVGYASPGEAEAARDQLRSRNVRTPVATRNTPTTAPSGSDMRPLRPGTPTSDTLSRRQQSRLARNGSIRIKGVTYTTANIAAADADRIITTPKSLDSPARGDTFRQRTNTPDTPPKRWTTKTGRAAKWLGTLIGRRVPSLGNFAFNVAALEDALDVYIRAIVDNTPTNEAERLAYIEKTKSKDYKDLPQAVRFAYLDTIGIFTKTLMEGVVAVLLSGLSISAAAALLGLIGVSTGGIGFLLAILGGAGILILGTNGLYSVLDSYGTFDYIEANWIIPNFLPGAMLAFADAADGTQLSLNALIPLADPFGESVEESIEFDEIIESTPQPVANPEADNKLKQLIKNNPELYAAFQKGKPEAMKVMKSLKSSTGPK